MASCIYLLHQYFCSEGASSCCKTPSICFTCHECCTAASPSWFPDKMQGNGGGKGPWILHQGLLTVLRGSSCEHNSDRWGLEGPHVSAELHWSTTGTVRLTVLSYVPCAVLRFGLNVNYFSKVVKTQNSTTLQCPLCSELRAPLTATLPRWKWAAWPWGMASCSHLPFVWEQAVRQVLRETDSREGMLKSLAV